MVVDYVETHVGHEMEFRSQRLTTEQQHEIAEKCKAGVPPRRIIQAARKLKGNELTRYNLTNTNDVAYIKRKFGIEKKRDPDDMVAVSMKVQEWNSSGENDAFLFKKIGM